MSEFEPQYHPGLVPAGMDPMVVDWIYRELQNIERALTGKVGMYGQEGAWFDALAPMATGKTAAGSPAMATFNTDWQALEFKVGDAVFLFFHINHDIKRDSYIYPHVHWSTDDTDVRAVKWQIDMTWAKGHNQEAFPAKTTVTVEQAASGTAWQHMITEVSDNDAFYAPEVDSVVIIKVTRVTNTAASDKSTGVFGLFVDLHYQMERTGTLNKAPNFYER